MTQNPYGPGGPEQGPGGPQLPDFRGGGAGPAGSGPGGAASHGPSGPSGHDPGGGDGRGPRRGGVGLLIAGGLGAMAVLLVVTALVLSLTVFRPSDDPLAGSEHTPGTEEPERDPAEGEYIPDGEESSEPDEEVTHLEAPTTPCEFHPQGSQTSQSPGTRSSGDLHFTIPGGWGTELDWGQSLPHATDVATAEKHIELQFYSVAQVGQVQWTGAEGDYPGAEEAAAAYVQCHLTRADGEMVYGTEPELSGYRSEAVDVDGYEGWMVRGVVEVLEDSVISTYEEVQIVAVVVETPSGPAVFKAATSADDPQLEADVEDMLESLTVG